MSVCVHLLLSNECEGKRISWSTEKHLDDEILIEKGKFEVGGPPENQRMFLKNGKKSLLPFSWEGEFFFDDGALLGFSRLLRGCHKIGEDQIYTG